MCSEAGTRTETGSTADQEDGAQAAQSYLALVGVGVFTHDALVVPDVLEGLAGETPARSTHSCAHLGLALMEVGPAGAGACQTFALAGLGGRGWGMSQGQRSLRGASNATLFAWPQDTAQQTQKRLSRRVQGPATRASVGQRPLEARPLTLSGTGPNRICPADWSLPPLCPLGPAWAGALQT